MSTKDYHITPAEISKINSSIQTVSATIEMGQPVGSSSSSLTNNGNQTNPVYHFNLPLGKIGVTGNNGLQCQGHCPGCNATPTNHSMRACGRHRTCQTCPCCPACNATSAHGMRVCGRHYTCQSCACCPGCNATSTHGVRACGRHYTCQVCQCCPACNATVTHGFQSCGVHRTCQSCNCAPLTYLISVSPNSIDYMQGYSCGYGGIPKPITTITIKNVGTGTITNLSVSNHIEYYSMSSLSTTTIGPNGSATFTITPLTSNDNPAISGTMISGTTHIFTISGSNGVNATFSIKRPSGCGWNW